MPGARLPHQPDEGGGIGDAVRRCEFEAAHQRNRVAKGLSRCRRIGAQQQRGPPFRILERSGMAPIAVEGLHLATQDIEVPAAMAVIVRHGALGMMQVNQIEACLKHGHGMGGEGGTEAAAGMNVAYIVVVIGGADGMRIESGEAVIEFVVFGAMALE